MEYQAQKFVSGAWAKADEIKNGTRAKIVSETKPQSSSYTNKDGSPKTQDVAKVRFEDLKEPLNVSLNRATVNGLVEAFGKDSIDWQNHYLRVETEKMRVAGKAVTAMYLIPEGFIKTDDENGYATIVKEGQDAPAQTHPEVKSVEYPDGAEEGINPEDIPF